MDKQRRAVMVGLKKVEEDRLRITLDDLVQENDTSWRKDVLVTFKDYDATTFESLDFTDKELADFGYHVITRLYSFLKQEEI